MHLWAVLQVAETYDDRPGDVDVAVTEVERSTLKPEDMRKPRNESNDERIPSREQDEADAAVDEGSQVDSYQHSQGANLNLLQRNDAGIFLDYPVDSLEHAIRPCSREGLVKFWHLRVRVRNLELLPP